MQSGIVGHQPESTVFGETLDYPRGGGSSPHAVPLGSTEVVLEEQGQGKVWAGPLGPQRGRERVGLSLRAGGERA